MVNYSIGYWINGSPNPTWYIRNNSKTNQPHDLQGSDWYTDTTKRTHYTVGGTIPTPSVWYSGGTNLQYSKGLQIHAGVSMPSAYHVKVRLHVGPNVVETADLGTVQNAFYTFKYPLSRPETPPIYLERLSQLQKKSRPITRRSASLSPSF